MPSLQTKMYVHLCFDRNLLFNLHYKQNIYFHWTVEVAFTTKLHPRAITAHNKDISPVLLVRIFIAFFLWKSCLYFTLGNEQYKMITYGKVTYQYLSLNRVNAGTGNWAPEHARGRKTINKALTTTIKWCKVSTPGASCDAFVASGSFFESTPPSCVAPLWRDAIFYSCFHPF